MNSIRQRLLIWQITALVVTAVLVSVLTYRLALNGFNRVRDYGLQQIAYSVVRHGVRPQPGRANPPLPPPEADVAPARPVPAEGDTAGDEEAIEDLGQFVSQIWQPDGTLVYSSLDGGGPPLQAAGFHRVDWNGELWRVYTVIDRNQTVQVAVTSADRAASFEELVPWLLAPLGLLVVLLGLLIHTAVERALAPLETLGRDIQRRGGRELHPLPTADLPEELTPLGEALNQLLARVDVLLTGQQRLLADAAHELNTPLAAIKLQAQLARRAADSQRADALDELDAGIERATHLVAQLLQMARLEPDVRERSPQAVRCDRLAARSVSAFSAQADARGIDLGLVASDAATAWVDPDELRLLLDNLVDNALRYTPGGGRVDVGVRALNDGVVVSVDDDGPGIPAPDRERVLQRFVRLNPLESSGSGLGLAIVVSAVRHNGGTLSLQDSDRGGLAVRVTLPAAPPDSGGGVVPPLDQLADGTVPLRRA